MADNLQAQKDTIAKVTGEIMQLPAHIRGTILNDAHELSGGDINLHARILGIAYALLIASSLVDPLSGEDPIGTSIVQSSFVIYGYTLQDLAKAKRDGKTTIDNLTAALAILKEEDK